ncbi:MAG: helix-turn-helix transcriptional regulator [Anaerolineales bacterium]|nr:helix-turn-helix transcriptional regulator [Anaerolineales bacterium]
MDRKKFGQLIAALRKEHYDEFGAVWTQTKLAHETNLSETLIGNIERGAKANLEPDLLLNLATALHLTTGERYEFFAAASGVDPIEISHDQTAPTTGLHTLLSIMKNSQLPAAIFDVYSDIVAINHAAAVIGGVQKMFANAATVTNPLMFNSTYHYFAPEFEPLRRAVGPNPQQFAYRNMMNFRINSLRYRAEPYFRYLLMNLMRSNIFQITWRRLHLVEEDHFIDTVPIQMQGTPVGSVHFTTSTISSITKYGTLKLMLYVPLSWETSVAFQRLVGDGGARIYSLAPWPYKQVPADFV